MTSALGIQAERPLLRTSGALLLGGLVLNAAVTMLFHPSGDEDVHEDWGAEGPESTAPPWGPAD